MNIAHEIFKIIACLISGACMVYCVWFIINWRRKAEHTAMYSHRNIALRALGLMCVNVGHIMVALTIPSYGVRFIIVTAGLFIILLSLIWFEDENA